MRNLPAMEQIWRNEELTGDKRPVIRATIVRPMQKLFTYALKSLGSEASVTFSGTDTASVGKLADDPQSLFQGEDVTEVYATHWVHNDYQPLELPNIKTCEWSRSIDQDAAEMTLTMMNVHPLSERVKIGPARPLTQSTPHEILNYGDNVFDMDQLGYFSPSRGATTDSARWGHKVNPWAGMLMPDNIIKTYQGYGCDWSIEPESDPNLAQTGVWMIDDISFTAVGLITIKCRDLGRLLLQQGFEAPVLPNDFNPTGFKAWSKEDLTRDVNITFTETVRVAVTGTSNGTSGSERQLKRFFDVNAVQAAVRAANSTAAVVAVLNGVPATHSGAQFAAAVGQGNVDSYTYQAAPAGSVKDAALVMVDEIAKYPSWFLKKIGLHKVTMVGTFSGGVAGLAYGQDFYYSIAGDIAGTAGIFHHELTHIWQITVDAFWRSSGIKAQWEALAPYSPGSQTRRPGFISPYASTNSTEDVADMMRGWMVSGEQQASRDVAATDAVVATKYGLLRRLLSNLSIGNTPDLGGSGQYGPDFFYDIVVGTIVTTTQDAPPAASGTTQRTRQPLSNPHSSTEAWVVGTNGDGGPGKIKDPNNYHGRGPQQTLDDNGATYWISVGNSSPRAPYAYEWCQYDLPGGMVNEVMVDPIKSGYQAYVSVMKDGVWLGAQAINYHEAGIGRNGSNIPFVAQASVNQGRNTITFPPVDRAQKLRVTLGNLQNWSANFGAPAYRAAIASVEAYATTAATQTPEVQYRDEVRTSTTTKQVTLPPGAVGENPWNGSARYSDFTDVVKLFCAWGGFYWPQDIVEATSASTNAIVEGEVAGIETLPLPNFRKYHFETPDIGVLGHVNGRVWGDFMSTGQSGPAPIDASNFKSKSLMDGIHYFQDIVSFNFWIDEFGACQWRYPNIDNIGCWIADNSADVGRTQLTWDIDEKQVLTDLETTLSSRKLAEIVILKNLVSKAGYVSSGYNPNPTGLRRTVIWNDAEHLVNDEEAKIMGDLTATRMLFSYRTNNLKVPGFPGIQIDDQIKVHERTASDSFYHLVTGISSSHDNDAGTWDYNLTTMWLGDDPEGRWTIPRVTRDTRDSSGTSDQPVESKTGRTLK